MDVDPSALEDRLIEKYTVDVMYKIIIRAPNHLGDLLMAQPAVRGLVKNCLNEKISLLLPEWAEVIYRDIENIKMLPLEQELLHGGHAIFRQRDRISGKNFDTGILLTPSFSSALVFYLSGIKRRYGYKGDGRNFLLNHAIDHEEAAFKHRSVKYLHLMTSFIGKDIVFEPPKIKLFDETRKSVEKKLDEYGINRDTAFIAVAPQAIAESRRWGSANYAALSEKLIDKFGVKIILLGAVNEYQAGEQIARDSGNIINLCGKTDIEAAAAILSLSRLFIGNDSGLAHLAAAVDTPLVVLSGADRPSETSPISEKKIILIKDNLDCISCVKNICPKKENDFMKCMKDISVVEVFDAAQSMFLK